MATNGFALRGRMMIFHAALVVKALRHHKDVKPKLSMRFYTYREVLCVLATPTFPEVRAGVNPRGQVIKAENARSSSRY